MLKSKNMPYSYLTFGKGGQDKVLFPALILSKSKRGELAPCTEKTSTATGIFHGEQVWPAAGRRQCSTQQKLLLVLLLILVDPLCKRFISSNFREAAASSFASRIFCYCNRVNFEVKLKKC